MSNYRPLASLAQHVATQPNAPFLHQPFNREWTSYTFSEVDEQSSKMAAALLQLGLEKGDRVAILGKNCAEWIMADLAIMKAGLISVPIYFSAGADTIDYVIEHSEAKAVFVGKLDNYDHVAGVFAGGIKTISFPYPMPACDLRWQDLIAVTPAIEQPYQPSDDDLLSIIYTSGSTGKPKGVMISFGNCQAIGVASAEISGDAYTNADRVVSYLPLAHIAERGLVELTALHSGMQIFFVESLDTFREDICHAEPTVFFAVPRIWLKIQLQVLDKIGPDRFAKLIKLPIVGKLLAKKVRKTLGLHKARVIISGSAPISPDVLKWYHQVGLPISEGWAMSETSCVGTINLPFRAEDIGSIGRPLPGADIKLSEDGEILIRGAFITPGYFKNPAATAETMDGEWLKTGDLGRFRASGALEIIGRVKEQFKTSKGKYVSPVGIESLLSAFPQIEQVCVMGSGLPQPIALVVLAEGIPCNAETLEAIAGEANLKLEAHERLDAVIVCSQPWLIENGLLTPTMKLKRDAIEKCHQPTVDGYQRSANKVDVIYES